MKEFHVDKITARVTDQQGEFCGVSCAAETAEAAASVMLRPLACFNECCDAVFCSFTWRGGGTAGPQRPLCQPLPACQDHHQRPSITGPVGTLA